MPGDLNAREAPAGLDTGHARAGAAHEGIKHMPTGRHDGDQLAHQLYRLARHVQLLLRHYRHLVAPWPRPAVGGSRQCPIAGPNDVLALVLEVALVRPTSSRAFVPYGYAAPMPTCDLNGVRQGR